VGGEAEVNYSYSRTRGGGGIIAGFELLPIQRVPSGFLGGALASFSGRCYEEGRRRRNQGILKG